MRCLITGVKGFIGGHLYHKLKAEGNEVLGIDNLMHPSNNPDIPFIYGDVRYYHDIEKYVKWCDVVFHLAAQIHVDKSISNVEETMEINVKGTMNILEACKNFDKRMIFASSSEVYGTSQKRKMDESHQLDAQSPYAASKCAGDRLCKSYFDTYGTRVSILRNFNTFGEWQNDDSYGGVIAIFTKAALSGQDLRIFGSGEQMRDYMYISDAIEGYKLCMKDELIGKVINIGSGKTITINELANLIIKITQSKSKVIHTDPRSGEVMRLCADTTFAKTMGFVSKTDFEKDLSRYVKHFEQYLNNRNG
jgi:nucleoside-diphosphate-sugar epimerase